MTGDGAVRAQYSASSAAITSCCTCSAPTRPGEAAVERLQADVKRLTRELQDAKVKAALGGGGAAARGDDTDDVGGAR